MGPKLRFENSKLKEYLRNDTPLAFNQVIDEAKLDQEYDEIQAQIKKLLASNTQKKLTEGDVEESGDDEDDYDDEIENPEAGGVSLVMNLGDGDRNDVDQVSQEEDVGLNIMN